METSNSRSRAWFCTLLNYTDEEYKLVTEIDTVYKCYCKEICPTTETPHLHFYLFFKSARQFTTMKRKFPRARLDQSNSNFAQGAKDYCLGNCSKKNFQMNDTFMESGQMPAQGARNDIGSIKEIIKSGGRMRDVVEVATSLQSVRMAEIHLKYFEQKRKWKPTVKWYWGKTGTGKSRTAFEELDDPYVCMETNTWWEGYDAHQNVIIDDMRKDFCKFHTLLRILDRYPHQIECKGGARQFLSKTIIITSSLSPLDMYQTREDISQLLRRIDEIREFK